MSISDLIKNKFVEEFTAISVGIAAHDAPAEFLHWVCSCW